ncbi:DegV family protein [Atopobium sp. oral taxon 810]|uniref:DegV family protein n=1 Tax=Atopobium sp. oral taxon 810 TaxID=712158 RepID=UPI0003971EDA|nr:DegV family protein [Atopobium sp. oral taxon 810]ERI04587.1 EDD domain protein, DegV family [Atopobium sp. oral taxon 810 str. F0209]
MAIRIICDSAADVSDIHHEQLTVMPISVAFGNEIYLDNVDLSNQRFYEMLLETDTTPTTGQVTPYAFDQEFSAAVERDEKVVAITVSSRLSGTYASAESAAQPYGDNVRVIDSLSASLGTRVLVEYALRCVDQGIKFDQLVEDLQVRVQHVRVLALLNTLEYLRRGGRLPAAAAALGNLLSIKPVITAEDGVISLVGKARGSKAANNLLTKMIEKCGGINFDMPVAVGYTGLESSMLKKYVEDNSHLWEGKVDELAYHSMGGAIGTHAGPGAIAVAFFANS